MLGALPNFVINAVYRHAISYPKRWSEGNCLRHGQCQYYKGGILNSSVAGPYNGPHLFPSFSPAAGNRSVIIAPK